MKLGFGLSLNTARDPIGSYASAYTTALIAQSALDGYALPSASTLAALDAMLIYLEEQGIDILIDALWVTATDGDRDFAKYNVLNPATFYLTEIGTLTFTANQGFTGDGASSYLDTNFNVLSDSVRYLRDDAAMGYYCFAGFDNGSDMMHMGYSGGNGSFLGYVSGTYRTLINSANSGVPNIGTPGNGLSWADRSISSQFELFSNGISLGSWIKSSTAIIEDITVSLLTRKRVGTTPIGYSTATISLAFIGGSLSAKAVEFNTAINNYITSI